MTWTEVLGVVGLVVILLLAGATLLGFIDWSDPKGLK